MPLRFSLRRAKTAKPKNGASLGEWLDQIVENPDNAPTILRPHIQSLQQAQPKRAEDMEYEEAQGLSAEVAQNTPRQPAPQGSPNQHRSPHPTRSGRPYSAWNEGQRFYENNREAIKEAWRTRRNRRG